LLYKWNAESGHNKYISMYTLIVYYWSWTTTQQNKTTEEQHLINL